MFARPRPKKSLLPPPAKRRKTTSAIEEINFDFDARADYLTGFHKRKVQRAKQAQEEAGKKAKEERIAARKQVSLVLAQARQSRINEISCARSVDRNWRRI
jgi:ribosomal RNA-processing protein 17